ncbi:DUF1178 family protein [Oceanicella actignis]|uniref:DUF1178 family protein n=1 Tax=Oceanicella actignis TaxID=1189325 RepID=UPI0011E71D85|nr:DUF1178 family protein [Oceanicella actignis]TYO91212.1 hypothetical protein LY05_00063 [Oceanicella actignis]
MIRYALKCKAGHAFESWFQSSEAFDRLQAAGRLSCAVCGGAEVEKALMAPNVAASAEGPARPLSEPASPAEALLRALRERLERHGEYVGRDFAREARAIHAGEADARLIYGEASVEEARALLEEGAPVAPLPFPVRRDG